MDYSKRFFIDAFEEQACFERRSNDFRRGTKIRCPFCEKEMANYPQNIKRHCDTQRHKNNLTVKR